MMRFTPRTPDCMHEIRDRLSRICCTVHTYERIRRKRPHDMCVRTVEGDIEGEVVDDVSTSLRVAPYFNGNPVDDSILGSARQTTGRRIQVCVKAVTVGVIKETNEPNKILLIEMP